MVPGTGVATYDMLWHGEPVGSLCAIRKADLPRVLSMAHCRSTHLCYCSVCEVVPIPYLGGLSTYVMRAGELCCGYGCGHTPAHE